MTIQSLYDSGRMPHAVLFIGGESRARAELAVRLHKCAPEDMVQVKESMPEEKYKIEPLRKIVATGNLRPQFGDVRVFVFREFDSMSDLCQNALLKFIEEPQEYNRFVMSAESAATILPTILSRAVVIRDSRGDSQTASTDSTDSTDSTEGADSIARNIAAALSRRSEYEVLAAFARVKDRLMLEEVLQSLLTELFNSGDAGQIEATDVVQKHIRRMGQTNPNVPMTAAACAAELYTKEFTWQK
jgi:DNA polymerase III delta prime subunit